MITAEEAAILIGANHRNNFQEGRAFVTDTLLCQIDNKIRDLISARRKYFVFRWDNWGIDGDDEYRRGVLSCFEKYGFTYQFTDYWFVLYVSKDDVRPIHDVITNM